MSKLLPHEVVCQHCGRNALNARFNSPKVCCTCHSRATRGKKLLADLSNKPHERHICQCGAWKSADAQTCFDCIAVAKAVRTKERLDNFDVDTARRDLVSFLRRVGFTGDSVPTN